MKKLLVALIAAAFAATAFAQAPKSDTAPATKARSRTRRAEEVDREKAEPRREAKAKSDEAGRQTEKKDGKKQARIATIASPTSAGLFFALNYARCSMHRRQFLTARMLLAIASRAAAQPLKPWGGVVTPPLELADLDGKTHRLADYRGKAVLVNFWATWCAPCRDEMPSIERLRAALAGAAVRGARGQRRRERARRRASSRRSMPLGFPLLLDRDTKALARLGRAHPAGDLRRRPGRRGALQLSRRARLGAAPRCAPRSRS